MFIVGAITRVLKRGSGNPPRPAPPYKQETEYVDVQKGMKQLRQLAYGALALGFTCMIGMLLVMNTFVKVAKMASWAQEDLYFVNQRLSGLEKRLNEKEGRPRRRSGGVLSLKGGEGSPYFEATTSGQFHDEIAVLRC